MIVFTLRCSKGHTQDEWFKSSEEYETLSHKSELKCRECGDTHLTKAVTAAAISGTSSSPQPIHQHGAGCGGGSCSTGMCPWSGQ